VLTEKYFFGSQTFFGQPAENKTLQNIFGPGPRTKNQNKIFY
jgi:hypothetical protein